MIYYEPSIDLWFSNINKSEHGTPTANLTGDTRLCICGDCVQAWREAKGKNIKDIGV